MGKVIQAPGYLLLAGISLLCWGCTAQTATAPDAAGSPVLREHASTQKRRGTALLPQKQTLTAETRKAVPSSKNAGRTSGTVTVMQSEQKPAQGKVSEPSARPAGTEGADEANVAAPDIFAETDRLRAEGKYAEAEAALLPLLERLEKERGAEHPDFARALGRRARLAQDLGRFAKAEPLFRRAIDSLKREPGAAHPDTARLLADLAGLLVALRRPDEAEPLAKAAHAIRLERLGESHPETAQSLLTLARASSGLDLSRKAEDHARKALAILKGTLPTSPDTADALDMLALALIRRNRSEEAEPLAEQAVKMREATQGADHPHASRSLDLLAASKLGRIPIGGGVKFARRSLKIREKALGANHPATMYSRHILALSLSQLPVWDRSKTDALDVARENLDVRLARFGIAHPDTVESARLVTTALRDLKRGEESVPLVEELLTVARGKGVHERPEIVPLIERLAEQYHGHPWAPPGLVPQTEKAEELRRQALSIRERALGRHHVLTADSLHGLALFYRDLGRYEDATPLLERAVAIEEQARETRHSVIFGRRKALAQLYRALDRSNDAEVAMRKALAAVPPVSCRQQTRDLDERLAGCRARLAQEPDGEERVGALLVRAATLLDMRRVDDALGDLGRVLDLASDNADAFILRSQAHEMRGEYRQALEDLGRSRRSSFRREQLEELADPAWARCRRSSGVKEAARLATIEACSEVLGRTPPEPEERRRKALQQRAMAHAYRDNELAIADYSALLKLDPGNKLILHFRSDLYAGSRPPRLDLALADIERLIALEPVNLQWLLKRGELHEKRKDFAAADRDYQRVIELDDGYPAKRARSNMAYRQSKVEVAAQEERDDDLKVCGDNFAHPDKRIPSCTRVFNRLKIWETNPFALLPASYKKLDESSGGGVAIGGDIDVMWINYATAIGLRGIAHHQKGDLDSALIDFSDSIDKAMLGIYRDGKGGSRDAMLLYRGRLYVEAGEYDRAEVDFRSVLRVNLVTNGYAHLAHLHFTRGEHDLAREMIALTLHREPDNIVAHSVRGRIALEQGDYGEAIKGCGRAVELAEAMMPPQRADLARECLHAARRAVPAGSSPAHSRRNPDRRG